MTPDRIEKSVLLRAPLAQVWHAVSDAAQFGTWFGVAFDGPFLAGTRLTGRIVPTAVDPDIAELQKPHEGKAFEFFVEAIEPMRRISFRWHPYAVAPNVDYAAEPTTLIMLELAEVEGGTLLVVTESGFDGIPLQRRAEAFRANESGWSKQMQLIEKYLAARAR